MTGNRITGIWLEEDYHLFPVYNIKPLKTVNIRMVGKRHHILSGTDWEWFRWKYAVIKPRKRERVYVHLSTSMKLAGYVRK
jgi:hypothetical protein